MTYEFNVDRFYAQLLGAFSIFVHLHDRGMKPGSNWILWSVYLMLTDFTPNWALFYFRYFTRKMGETWIKLNCLFCEFNVDGFWAQLGVFFYFRYFRSKSQKSGRVCVISMTQLSFFTLPAQPQGTVSYSFLLSFFKLGGFRLTYWDLDVSSFFLSFFLTMCFFFHMLDWIFTKLGQKHVWVYGYKFYGSKNSPGVIWGHKGKKVNNVKNMKTAPIQNLIMPSCRQ